jgi:5-methylcytosine-specific restriction endonuclease McrA
VAGKKSKRGKSRTQAKFHYACVQGMKQAFAHYSPKYGEVLQARKIRRPRFLADGVTRHKVDSVLWVCESCGAEVPGSEGLEVDHIEPVIPVDRHYSEMSMQEIFERLDCPRENLRAICENCHAEKTSREKALRREHGSDRKQ